MGRAKIVTRYVFGGLFVAAGTGHFLNPEFFVRIMPPYLPWHLALVLASGAAEVVLGALLFSQRYAVRAAWGLVALLVAVFPANMHMATNPESFPATSPAALWLRLPLQALLILWAYWYTRPDRAGPARPPGAAPEERKP